MKDLRQGRLEGMQKRYDEAEAFGSASKLSTGTIEFITASGAVSGRSRNW